MPESASPAVSTVHLAPEHLAALCADLAACASGVHVTVRDRARGTIETATLDGIESALRAGRAVQIRYGYGGDRWTDTLTPGSGGARLIRCRESAIPGDDRPASPATGCREGLESRSPTGER